MKSDILKLLQSQIEKEGHSSNLYLSMASWAENSGFPGIAEWLYAQAEEERTHMLKFIRFVNDRSEKATVPGYQVPQAEWKDVHTLFAEVLKHEQYITASINAIADACMQNKDYTVFNWIQWFISEQIEEERNVNAVLDFLKNLSPCGIHNLDRHIMKLRGE